MTSGINVDLVVILILLDIYIHVSTEKSKCFSGVQLLEQIDRTLEMHLHLIRGKGQRTVGKEITR